MILTLTLNPCIDHTIAIEEFLYGGTNKVLSTRFDISGKGINVSIVLKQLGIPTYCTGFSYGKEQELERELTGLDILHQFTPVDGKLRTNVKIFDAKSHVMTEFNDKGSNVSTHKVDELVELVSRKLNDTSIFVVDGSVPPGVPTNIYRRLIEMANKKGIKTVLDAYGDLFMDGLEAAPYLVKPNRDELESTFHTTLDSKEAIIEVAQQILAKGVRYVCVSMGADGALLVTPKGAYYSASVDIEVKGVQGSGDSMVAGMCIAIEKGLSDEEVLAYGMSAAHGSLLHEGTILCQLEDFHEMYQRITVEKL